MQQRQKLADASNKLEVREMGFGAMVARSAAVGLVSLGVIAGGNYALDMIRGSNAPIESGFVSPKSLSIEGKKNAAGNIESILQYKNGEVTVSLPCTKGPQGPLCGTVEYWWGSVEPGQREELVVGEWQAIGSDAKYGIMKGELQTILDTFYGAQKGPQAALQQQYGIAKQK